MYEKLPQELKERGAFCLWKYEERDGSMGYEELLQWVIEHKE